MLNTNIQKIATSIETLTLENNNVFISITAFSFLFSFCLFFVTRFLSWMYWSDWGASPRIERAGMDGSHRTTIINYDVKWPNGITLDLVRKRIYWVDGKLNIIASANYDGSQRRQILYSTDYLRHPFSITTFEDNIYWSDWDKQTVFKANKFNGKGVEAVTALHQVSGNKHNIKLIMTGKQLSSQRKV